MTVDRDALIEAAAKAIEREIKKYPVPEHGAFRGSIGWGASAADLGRAATDAILPLITDAIEAEGRQVVQSFEPAAAGRPGSVEMGRLIGAEDAYKHAMRVVRSLLSTDSDR